MSVSVEPEVSHAEPLTPSKVRRLHHHAYPIADQEANRYFMEDVLGIPLRATWTEVGEPRDDAPDEPVMEFCHTFYELADGGAMAFFQVSAPFDKKFLIGSTNALDHIALESSAEAQDEIHERLLERGDRPSRRRSRVREVPLRHIAGRADRRNLCRSLRRRRHPCRAGRGRAQRAEALVGGRSLEQQLRPRTLRCADRVPGALPLRPGAVRERVARRPPGAPRRSCVGAAGRIAFEPAGGPDGRLLVGLR